MVLHLWFLIYWVCFILTFQYICNSGLVHTESTKIYAHWERCLPIHGCSMLAVPLMSNGTQLLHRYRRCSESDIGARARPWALTVCAQGRVLLHILDWDQRLCPCSCWVSKDINDTAWISSSSAIKYSNHNIYKKLALFNKKSSYSSDSA